MQLLATKRRLCPSRCTPWFTPCRCPHYVTVLADAHSDCLPVSAGAAAADHRHDLCYRAPWVGSRPQPGLGKQIALDIARGLAFMHTHCIVHLVRRRLPFMMLSEPFPMMPSKPYPTNMHSAHDIGKCSCEASVQDLPCHLSSFTDYCNESM